MESTKLKSNGESKPGVLPAIVARPCFVGDDKNLPCQQVTCGKECIYKLPAGAVSSNLGSDVVSRGKILQD